MLKLLKQTFYIFFCKGVKPMTDYQIKILTLINNCKDIAKAEQVALDCLTYLLEEHSADQDTVVVLPVKAV